MKRRISLGSACFVLAGLVSFASVAETSEKLESPAALSRYAAYARQIAEECVRNHAYGLSTNGLSLNSFCQRMGNTEAIKVHSQNDCALNRPPAAGIRSRQC
jgi:hypothetical protein